MNVRVFLNPDGARWVDIGYPNNASLPDLAAALVNDGFLVAQHAFVPRSSIHSILTIALSENSGAKLTLFPGGKTEEPA